MSESRNYSTIETVEWNTSHDDVLPFLFIEVEKDDLGTLASLELKIASARKKFFNLRPDDQQRCLTALPEYAEFYKRQSEIVKQAQEEIMKEARARNLRFSENLVVTVQSRFHISEL